MADNVITADLDRARPGRSSPQGVKEILLAGVFWRIVVIEAILLVWSVGYRALAEGGTVPELALYALRIVLLVAVIVLFVWFTLARFLTRRIIAPLEALAEANRRLAEGRDLSAAEPPLEPEAPREIHEILSTRRLMVERLLQVSAERLRLLDYLRETFGRYVSQEVVAEVLAAPEGQPRDGRREWAAILVSDLRGYAFLAGGLDPEELVALLNRYLARMAEVILTHGGLIDEIQGDGLLVVFRGPAPAETALRAVACGVAMQVALAELNIETASLGAPALEMGLGINAGEVIAGEIGSLKRTKYAFVGLPVILAARIEANSTGGEVLLGRAAHDLVVGRVTVGPARTALMKGFPEPLVFFPVRAVGPPHDLVLPEPDAQEETRLELAFEWQPLEGKAVLGEPRSGHTLGVGLGRLSVRLDEPLPPLTDLRLRFLFCLEAHVFQDLYAKVTAVENEAGGPVHRLRITAMAPEDRDLLARWVAEPRSA